ncbi:MAG: TRIC cation channel family protein [Lachnospiraceae bacterium]|nr:TRIC cation channel family protein [Lachnospiraceae bacterium]
MTKEFIFIMDLMGTVAFAISGSMTAVEQGMDLFGILILALTTATGGGFIRDLTIGSLPPVVFRNPIYMILSFLTAGIVFLVLKFQSLRPHSERVRLVYEKTLLITDSMGLAAFTVDGVCAGLAQPDTNLFLAVFLGVITGVGGGILRDLFAGKKPYVFVKHVYAFASLAGAAAAYILPRYLGSGFSIMISFGIIILIRYLAAHYRWDLPRISSG